MYSVFDPHSGHAPGGTISLLQVPQLPCQVERPLPNPSAPNPRAAEGRAGTSTLPESSPKPSAEKPGQLRWFFHRSQVQNHTEIFSLFGNCPLLTTNSLSSNQAVRLVRVCLAPTAFPKFYLAAGIHWDRAVARVG